MAGTTVKRSEFATYVNISSGSVASYALLGDGITAASINYNPQTNEEIYIHETSGTTQVESYKPTMPIDATMKINDDVQDFIDTMRQARAVLGDAETDIVNVWLYETPTGSGSAAQYPAEQQDVSVQFESFGGDAGTGAKTNFTFNFLGDPVIGKFNPTSKEFTPDA